MAIVTGDIPEPTAMKYRQLLFILNWLEKTGEKLEVFGESDDGMLPMRFVGKNAAIQFDSEKKMWIGIQITDGDDL